MSHLKTNIALCIIFVLTYSLSQAQDTLGVELPKMKVDTLNKLNKEPSIVLSDDSLESQVDYGAKDSSRIDVVNNRIYLYGDAYVNFEDLKLEADMIIVDLKNNEAIAQSRKDSLNREIKQPHFVQADQDVVAKKLRFNFKTKKGMVYETVTKQKDLYIHGDKTKIVEGGFVDGHGDAQDVVYNKDAIFTTCNDVHPHYGIRSKKQILIKDKMVIVGPSNIEIAGIPTPLILPFGFFPLQNHKQTGLIFPRDFTSNRELGFGLQNVGWYFPINDRMDLTVLADIYLRGSFGLKAKSNYKKRYKYSGTFDVKFSQLRQERSESIIVDVNNSFDIQWTHSQDNSAHPYNSFSSKVHIQTNGFGKVNQADYQSVTNEQLTSNVTFKRILGDSGFNLNIQARHTQIISKNTVSVTLPEVSLNGGSIYPFRRKNRVGELKWYEEIPINYKARLKYSVSGIDSTFFSQQTLDDAKYGLNQNFVISNNIKLLKYIDIKPSVTLDESWYFKSIDKEYGVTITPIYNADTLTRIDTVYGAQDIVKNGFRAVHQLTPSVTVSTKLYGTKLFKKGFIRGVQHTMTPSISYSMTPDYTSDFWGYFDIVNDSSDPTEVEEKLYSHFEQSIYSSGISKNGSGSVSYRLGNNVEFKYFSKKDSTVKKFKLFDRFDFNGSYNPNADSLKFTKTSFSSGAKFINGKVNARFTGGIDYYKLNENNQRINTFLSEDSKRLFRFSNALLTLNTNFKLRELWEKKGNPKNEKKGNNANLLKKWVGDLNVNYGVNFLWEDRYTSDTLYVSKNILTLRGSIPLTEKWNLIITNIGYNFKTNIISYPDFTISRDLHCWEMGASLRPTSGTFSFYLRVKRSSLDFLNLPINKQYQDVPQF